jgi:hypothetical protein
VWRVESEGCGDVRVYRVGALALRGEGLIFVEDGGKEGGTERRRGFAVLKGEEVGIDLVVGNSRECCVPESLLFDGPVRERPA